MDYGLSWTIVDYCDTLLSWILKYAPPWNRMDYKICTPSLWRHLKGMAHTVASIGNVPSWYYCGQLRITDYHRLSWIIMDYLELLLITIDYGSWRIIMDYHGLWTIIGYRGLPGLLMDCGTLWIPRYAPPWNRMDYSICTPSLWRHLKGMTQVWRIP